MIKEILFGKKRTRERLRKIIQDEFDNDRFTRLEYDLLWDLTIGGSNLKLAEIYIIQAMSERD